MGLAIADSRGRNRCDIITKRKREAPIATPPADKVIVAGAEMRCWGDFALNDAATGAELRPRGRKARALLAYLATHPGKPIGRERLMTLLWGERGDEQARGSLRQTLFELRDLAYGRGLLSIGRDAVTLHPGALITDMDRLDQLASAGDYERLLIALPDYDETLFANLDGLAPGFDDWLRIERTRRFDALVALVAAAAQAAEATHDHSMARALRLRLAEFTPALTQILPAATTVGLPLAAPQSPVAVGSMRVRPWRLVTALLFGAALLAILGFSLRSQPRASAEATRTDARELYATARAEIHERNADRYAIAEALLRRAVAIDPNFASAWVSLGAVVAMRNPTDERLTEAERYVRRGLALAPGVAEAHGTLGMVLGFDRPEARAAIKKAAVLDPNDAQIQFWLSHVYASEGDYGRWLKAAWRAASIDPTWHPATGSSALASWQMGRGAEALAYRERLRQVSFDAAFNCEYAEDWTKGDYSAIIKETLAARPKLEASAEADTKVGYALLTLGYLDQARLLLRLPDDLWRFVSGEVPTRAVFRELHDRARHEEFAAELLPRAVGQLLNAGRGAEVVSYLDDPNSPLGSLASAGASAQNLQKNGVNVALALRSVGRSADADAILRRVEGAVRHSLALGPVPNWLHSSSAQLWAAQGRRDRALADLQTAIDNGWHYNPRAPRPDIADLPAFQTLRGDSRFERLRRRLRSDLDRERDEAALLTI